ncbi:MAG: fructosamine kinase family protein, partial [Bacteroidota bacterium]
MQPLIKHINQQLNTTVLSWTSLSGGDISSVYSLKTKDQDFVLKTNTQANASAMFRAEKLALESIA